VHLEAQARERFAQHRDDFLEVGRELGSQRLPVVGLADIDALVHAREITLSNLLKALWRDGFQILGRHVRSPAGSGMVIQSLECYTTFVERPKTRREIAAEATRHAIVEAAARLFQVYGYQATSVGRIAEEAGVAVQTIYNSVGSKRDVLSRVLDFAATGERAPAPALLREQAEKATEPRQIIDDMVEYWRGGLERTAPVFKVIRQAAALDPEVADLELQRAEQRLRNYGHAARILAERGALRHGLTEEDAAAAIFAVGHPDLYRFLVADEGWPQDRWAAWARDALEASLLGAP
jgi:AcrR family transcriptional regulator